MESIVAFLIQYGYWGMFAAAFLAGSFFPFSSEAVMVGLIAIGLDQTKLLIYASIGNAIGSMFNYGVGYLGKLEWIERYMHVKREKLERAQRFCSGRGAWIGFFAFLPLFGSVISIALGLMRANLPITVASISIGKLLRYLAVLYAYNLIF